MNWSWSRFPRAGALLAAAVVYTGCTLFSPAAKPLAAVASDRPLRLTLQSFNGCAVLGNGQSVPRGGASIPYPAQCADFNSPELAPAAPTGRIDWLVGRDYVLNRLTLMDAVTGRFLGPEGYRDALTWMKEQSRFQHLDWSQASFGADEWRSAVDYWVREVPVEGAAWMQHPEEDRFLVEVLGADGKVLAKTEVDRNEFWAESPVAGHTRVSWRASQLGPPTQPGDRVLHGVDEGSPPAVQSQVRIDLFGALDLSRTLRVEAASGDGAVRVTWSQLPKDPFYFPVHFLQRTESPVACWGGSEGDTPTACAPGLDPALQLTPPKNGKGFYQPGERLDLLVSLRDERGHLVHPREELPSFQQMVDGHANGLIYWTTGSTEHFLEQDAMPCFKVLGPLQKLRPPENVSKPSPDYWQYIPQQGAEPSEGELVIDIVAQHQLPGLEKVGYPTRVPFTVPKDAQPGTYVALLKAHREQFGERLSKGVTVKFEVGQAQPTDYPHRVGGCDGCHQGPVALDELRHGFAQTDIEACKGCHANGYIDLIRDIHAIHGRSPRYRIPKGDCTVCHLEAGDARRPSYELCSSCHANPHGEKFFQTEFNLPGAPSRYDNCAQACHGDHPPAGHVLR